MVGTIADTPVQTQATVPLSSVPPGGEATLHHVLDQESAAVLRSLGLTAGARLRVCQLGDPSIIQVRSTRIGISRAVARNVMVSLCGGAGQ